MHEGQRYWKHRSIEKETKHEPHMLTDQCNIFLKKFKSTVALKKSIMILCVHLNSVAWQQNWSSAVNLSVT